MYDKIQEIIFPSKLSSFDYERLEELKQTYTEEEIIEAYKNNKDKPLNYIIKTLKNKKNYPEWLDREITNEKVEQEDLDIFNDFQDFIKGIRNG